MSLSRHNNAYMMSTDVMKESLSCLTNNRAICDNSHRDILVNVRMGPVWKPMISLCDSAWKWCGCCTQKVFGWANFKTCMYGVMTCASVFIKKHVSSIVSMSAFASRHNRDVKIGHLSGPKLHVGASLVCLVVNVVFDVGWRAEKVWTFIDGIRCCGRRPLAGWLQSSLVLPWHECQSHRLLLLYSSLDTEGTCR